MYKKAQTLLVIEIVCLCWINTCILRLHLMISSTIYLASQHLCLVPRKAFKWQLQKEPTSIMENPYQLSASNSGSGDI